MAAEPTDVADAAGALWRPSPNFGPRRHGGAPSLIVLHYTAMCDAASALERLCDPCAEPGPVSAHYLVGRDGTCWQMVRETDRAWHAGAGNWADCDDVNSHSIGIELDNDGGSPFAEAQMAALERVLPGIMDRWSIAPAGVIAHSDMAPGRKIDPGPRFDWRRLARRGLALWPGDGQAGDIAQDLARIGYRDPGDCGGDILLNAFRARFRPWARGPVSDADRIAARSIADQVTATG